MRAQHGTSTLEAHHASQCSPRLNCPKCYVHEQEYRPAILVTVPTETSKQKAPRSSPAGGPAISPRRPITHQTEAVTPARARHLLQAHPDDHQLQATLSNHPDRAVRAVVARHHCLVEEAWLRLALDTSPRVREIVRDNVNAPDIAHAALELASIGSRHQK